MNPKKWERIVDSYLEAINKITPQWLISHADFPSGKRVLSFVFVGMIFVFVMLLNHCQTMRRRPLPSPKTAASLKVPSLTLPQVSQSESLYIQKKDIQITQKTEENTHGSLWTSSWEPYTSHWDPQPGEVLKVQTGETVLPMRISYLDDNGDPVLTAVQIFQQEGLQWKRIVSGNVPKKKMKNPLPIEELQDIHISEEKDPEGVIWEYQNIAWDSIASERIKSQTFTFIGNDKSSEGLLKELKIKELALESRAKAQEEEKQRLLKDRQRLAEKEKNFGLPQDDNLKPKENKTAVLPNKDLKSLTQDKPPVIKNNSDPKGTK